MSVTDNGYPVPQTDSSTVVVNIERDTFVPVWSLQGAQYIAQIQENADVGSSLINVSATRVNIIVSSYML